jgi:hypothetical protein
MSLLELEKHQFSSERELVPAFWRPVDETEIKASAAGIKSRFGEDVWDATALKGGSSSWGKMVNFHRIRKAGVAIEASIIQLKIIFYLLLHQEGKELPAASTFLTKYYALRNFAADASKVGYDVYQALRREDFIISFLKNRPVMGVELFVILSSLCDDERFPVKVDLKRLHPVVIKADRDARDAERQTPIIPPRIYSHILGALTSELEIVEAVIGDLVDYLHIRHGGSRGSYPEAGEKLRQYAAYLGQNTEEAPRLNAVAGWVTHIYAVCGVVIAAHTGMRRGEFESLPVHALSIFEHGGSAHACIRGTTSKFNKGRPKETEWVTNQLGKRAVQCAETLATALHSLNGMGDLLKQKNKLVLFPRHGVGSQGDYDGFKPKGDDKSRERLIKMICPVIEPSDIDDLMRMDTERDWRSEPEFAIGARWPLTVHQLRRSLALYAHSSGLVTLPSLKSQLQHLTQEMTMYYSRGSEFAKSIVFPDEHFARDWNGSRALSEYLGYAANVLMSDERLFGGGAAWANSPAVKLSPVSVHSRAHALEMFERGEIAYRETVVGGCTSTSICESLPLSPIPFECLEKNCKNLVASPRKIRKVAEIQAGIVNRLNRQDNKSVEYRLEKKGLDVLLGVLAKIDKQEIQ